MDQCLSEIKAVPRLLRRGTKTKVHILFYNIRILMFQSYIVLKPLLHDQRKRSVVLCQSLDKATENEVNRCLFICRSNVIDSDEELDLATMATMATHP
ncbi:hypothetical protein SDJN03_09471, partial [Cucurbita argyrosperma subsp. sororia]